MNTVTLRGAIRCVLAALMVVALAACATPRNTAPAGSTAKCNTVDWNRCVYLF